MWLLYHTTPTFTTQPQLLPHDPDFYHTTQTFNTQSRLLPHNPNFCHTTPTFTTQPRLLTTLKKQVFENIVGKGENAGNQHFLLFP